MDRTSELIKRLVSSTDSADRGRAANELLAEYHRGSSLESLRSLLESANESVLDDAAWIASELGETGKPLLSDIARLLAHPSKKVRFWAIDCVHLWADPSNSRELASTVALVEDIEEAVRWKAMVFLAFASREQLQGAAGGLTAINPHSPLTSEIKWMLSPQGADPAQITIAIRASDALHRKIAAAAAVRVAKTNSEPLRYAALAGDLEVAQFAVDMLERVAPFQ